MRFSPLAQITPANVGQLTRGLDLPHRRPAEPEDRGRILAPRTRRSRSATRSTPAPAWASSSRSTPRAARRSGATTRRSPADAIPYGATCRGVAYYAVPAAAADAACATRIVWGTLDARLLAIDAKTGKPCEDFGSGGSVDLTEGIGYTVPGWYPVTAPPVIVRGIVVPGAQVKDNEATEPPRA